MNEEALKRIDALADKLGVAAQYLWGVLVRQARIEAAQDIAFVLFDLAFIFCVYMAWKAIGASVERSRRASPDELFTKDIVDWLEDHPPIAFAMIVASIASVVLLIWAVFTLFVIPTEIFNPEYWALKQILGN